MIVQPPKVILSSFSFNIITIKMLDGDDGDGPGGDDYGNDDDDGDGNDDDDGDDGNDDGNNDDDDDTKCDLVSQLFLSANADPWLTAAIISLPSRLRNTRDAK